METARQQRRKSLFSTRPETTSNRNCCGVVDVPFLARRGRIGNVRKPATPMKITRLLAALTGRTKKSDSSRNPALKDPGTPSLRPSPLVMKANRYHAVSIVSTEQSCLAARTLRGERFLSSAAPSLPLVACTCPTKCPCHFRKHQDRRHYDRRAPGSTFRWYGKTERRQSTGRRADDF